MTSLLFASKIGAIGAKVLTGAAIAKAAPVVVPVACAVVCVGATVAGAKYLSKKLGTKEPVCVNDMPADVFCEDEYMEDDNAEE